MPKRKFRQKFYIIKALLLFLAFSTKALAALTFNASSITSDGTLTLTPAINVVINGNVGLGTTNPLTKLTVLDTSSSSPRGILSMQISDDTLSARVGFAKARGTPASPTTVLTGDNLGRLLFRGYDGTNYLEMGSIEVGASGTIAPTRVPTFMTFATATDAAPSVLTERMRIDNAGNVGIGTTSPGYTLDIVTNTPGMSSIRLSDVTTDATTKNGKIVIRPYTNANVDFLPFQAFSNATDNVVRLGGSSGNLNAATIISFYTTANNNTVSGTERVRIDSSGNVGIGTTSPNANAILDVTSTTKAFMPPRMTTTQRDAIPSPTAGMVIYNSTTNKLNVYTTIWEAITSS